MKKELMIFTGIFLFLAIAMHFKEWISHPVDHLMALPNAGAFGLGPLHPLIITFVVYIIFLIIRGIAKLFKR
ncbi:hypothetical protein YH65_06650 [Sulfurovum lithotrophicum]|uniref:Uncharacterized protein n=1 Tax=Sulfurovum lithotrophicum TaxID=206403 RepID=A0A7U4M1E9_9BACT|nr:hypothetical protein [Sulfurovum lithotrophicum]AKF25109.1 hypothetical protein YH65_06650 [Sulfurovum lithotrophicum]